MSSQMSVRTSLQVDTCPSTNRGVLVIMHQVSPRASSSSAKIEWYWVFPKPNKILVIHVRSGYVMRMMLEVGFSALSAERLNFKLWVLFTAVNCPPIPAKNTDTLRINPPFCGPSSVPGRASLVRFLPRFGPDEILASLGRDAVFSDADSAPRFWI